MAMPGDPVESPSPDKTKLDAEGDTTMDGVEQTEEQEKLKPEIYEAIHSLLDAIYAHRDADGHDPSKAFHKRPNKRNFPDYYETIQEPIALSNIKSKTNQRGYTAFADFVCDLALLWHNSLVYNRPEAVAYVDAITIRGLLETQLKKIVETGLVSAEEIEWPELGEIPSADAEDDVDEDAESGREGEEDEEEAENSEAEISKPRRRGRRASTLKRGENQADGANTRRGRPPKVDTPLEARIKNVLKAIRKPKFDSGIPMVYHFEKLPDKVQLPDYYIAIRNPIALEQIKKSLKRKRYNTFEQCLADLELMFENAKLFNEDDSDVFKAAVELQTLARKAAEEEKAKSDDDFAFEEGRKPKPDGITYDGKVWKVGDWVLLRNRNDVTKPIVAQIYRTWEDSNGLNFINCCWYYRPEQTVHHFEKHFWPNEVLKTSQYRDHPIEDVLGKCFVMFFTRFTRGRPRGLSPDTEVFVCEARYNEEKHKINKIKTWSSCLPDEVRDKDYEMDMFEAQKRIKKLPSPLEHKSAEAQDDGTMPEPRMGVEDAPPIEGGVYKGPRDDHQSPPPSPTPSPPPPAPVQPVRQISQTPARDSPSKTNRGNDVDSAMASATRAFGAGNQNPTNFIQQRQHQASGSPAPQSQYHAYNQGASQGHSSAHYTAHDTPSTQRHSSFRPDQAMHRQVGSGVPANARPSDVMTLPPAANSAIPLEVRAKLQTNDLGEVLFFPQPPRPELANSKIPTELRTSLHYRINRFKQRSLAQSSQNTTDSGVKQEQSLKVNGASTVQNGIAKRDSAEDISPASKRAKSQGQPLWATNPVTLADIDLKDPVRSIDQIDEARINPATDVQYLRSFGVTYKELLKSLYIRHQQIWSGLVPGIQLEKVMQENVSKIAADIERIRSQEKAENLKTAEEQSKMEYFWSNRANLTQQPDFFLEDRDPLYCGLSWTGPNPLPFNGGSTAPR